MKLYTNAFRCASKDDGSEVIIDFLQESPKYSEEQEIIGKEFIEVASVVMSSETAANLMALIGSAPTVRKIIEEKFSEERIAPSEE